MPKRALSKYFFLHTFYIHFITYFDHKTLKTRKIAFKNCKNRCRIIFGKILKNKKQIFFLDNFLDFLNKKMKNKYDNYRKKTI